MGDEPASHLSPPVSPTTSASARERALRALPALIGLALFFVALEVLRRELHAVSWRTLTAAIAGTPVHLLLAASGVTAINYAVLTAYDFIALRSIGRRLPSWRVGGASFLAYAIANNVGFAMLSGASVRYRFYTRWGLTAAELSSVVISYSVTFWLGLMTLGGLTLLVSPLPDALGLPAPRTAAVVGAALLCASGGYVAAAWRHRAPLCIRGFELRFPSVGLATLQVLTSSVEWALAASIVYVLLPPSGASFVVVLGAFLVAQMLGLAAHVPGGVGVFEGLMVLLLKPFLPSAQLVPALIVYRVLYYAIPLAIAVSALLVDEAWLRRAHAVRAAAFIGRLAEQITPRLLAALTFAAGMVLLFSGATPAAEHRLALLHHLVPLGIIETSHVIGSITGAVLLLLSQGLARRLDAAYYLTVGALAAGMIASLLRAGGWEEALILGVLLLLLRRARTAFTRTAAFFATRFSAAWIASVVAVLAASVWLGFFAFKHVEYSHDLWWYFALNGDASRFLRGTVGAATVVLLFAVARLIGHAPAEVEEPSADDLSRAGAIIATQPATYPNVVYLRDKAVLLDEAREAFLMYGVQGRTWVALKDPVGPADRACELIRLFIERCDDFGGTPAFYEVGTQYLHHYADFGFTTAKIGEEARVDLAAFTLDGPRGARYRQVTRRFAKDGCTFRVIPAGSVPAMVPALANVSDDWLREKAVAEKGFSVGYFDRDYLARFPAAIVELEGRLVAFATLWPGGSGQELSLDLMRYHHDAPKNVMEALIVHTMLWGQSNGYGWFSLGTAPMSGFEASAVAPLRSRAGHFLYQHGARLYNFQGLRAFKEKFDPVWESRYLVYPGGLRLPRIAADVSALIAGGYRRIFSK
ncbi:MAG TPA: bifunctional lysylphosphatidylglycerol flippase/synthetase MprF [Vicinamibacterales bacterium]|nr:bifunctional lysylphosphatidylglycerol flippase/synthetase MprF [Vicinamibacterales bacterium]